MLGNMAIEYKARLLQNQAKAFCPVPTLAIFFEIGRSRAGFHEGHSL